MFTVDKYLGRIHNIKTYNCWDFIRDVWLDLKNEDIGDRTPKVVSRVSMKEKFVREEIEFTKIDKPEDPCIVLFKRKNILPHVGVYVKGKVLHLPERNSSKYEDLYVVGLGFKEIGFYKCQENKS